MTIISWTAFLILVLANWSPKYLNRIDELSASEPHGLEHVGSMALGEDMCLRCREACQIHTTPLYEDIKKWRLSQFWKSPY